jgi:hypothetical protein
MNGTVNDFSMTVLLYYLSRGEQLENVPKSASMLWLLWQLWLAQVCSLCLALVCQV